MNFFITSSSGRTRLFGLAVLMSVVSGFSSNSFAQPQAVQLSEVKTCRYLRQIEGGSGYGKNPSWRLLAKHAALSKAEKIAATHVVWMRFDAVGGFNGVAVADAYRCDAS
jgi:hypothetical protein